MNLVRILSVSVALGVLPLTALGCSAPADDDGGTASSALGAGKLTASELASVKAELRDIAYADIDREESFEAVRDEIQPLVDKLAKHFGKKSAASKLPLVAGAWRQIWSDFPYPMSFFVKMDRRQVYQVVSTDGHYYNLGDQRSFLIFPTTGVLRGKYELAGDRLNVQFTRVGFRFGKLDRDDDLEVYADDVERGAKSIFGIPGGGRAPKGPVGIKGTLETLYVDADLRIERGSQEDFLDEDGNVLVPGTQDKLFILDRVVTPVK